MDEDEILTGWALRFDGYRYCEETGWPADERQAVTDRAVTHLEIPADSLRQLTVFFMLQRYLCKWGGEMLGRRTFDWRAYRTLFLTTAMHEIPAQWRAGEWYERWDRDFRPRSGECLSVVARFHSAACYRSTECLADVERELIYYDLEQYLFETVGPRFHLEGSLSAFDFFSIIIWKANRAKSRVAKGLRKHGMLESVVEELARALYEAKDCCDRFTVLTGRYGFRLPMASAILSVLWPDEFSIYDVRVCESFPGRFDKLADVSDSAKRWAGYEEYIEAVREFVPGTLSLRDKDRVLWARSAMQQLDSDLKKWNRD